MTGTAEPTASDLALRLVVNHGLEAPEVAGERLRLARVLGNEKQTLLWAAICHDVKRLLRPPFPTSIAC